MVFVMYTNTCICHLKPVDLLILSPLQAGWLFFQKKLLAKRGSSREGGDKGQEGDKGERGDELHGEVNFISLFVAY